MNDQNSPLNGSKNTPHAPRPTQYILPFVLLITFIILISLSCWLLYPVSDDGTLVEIQQRGTLRVGLDASFPPFESLGAEGQIVGLDIDIARTIANDLGVELQLVNIGFDGLYDALLARRVDVVLSGLPYDPRWTEDVAYTRRYFNAGQVLITPLNPSTITVVDDITGHTLAVEWGSQADMEGRHLEQELPNITILRKPTANEAIDSLFTGEADAAIVDAVSGVSAFPRGLKIIDYVTDEWYAGAVHIESTELLNAVNQSLTRLEKNGQMAALQAQWLHGQ